MASLLLISGFTGLILIGVPIAFAMVVAVAVAIFLGGTMPLAIIGQRMGSGVENFTFLAVPLFILAGTIMEHSGISRRLVNLGRVLVGHLPGGMGQVVIVSEIFFSGISGASLSDASAIGSLMHPALRRSGYQAGQATGLVAAACAMGVLIPPCLAMVVMGAVAGVSVTALFIAGLVPGLIMALALMVLVYVQARRGTLPGGEAAASWRETFVAMRESVIPLMMPVIIFGGILGGIFSPTEAAAVAVLYALIVGVLVYREITLRSFYDMLVETAKVTGAVGVIVGAASGFSVLLALEGAPVSIAAAVEALSSDPIVFLIVVNLLFLLFGALLDGIPALLLFVPILLPVATTLGIDPLHFTLLSIASLGVGMILPPIGIMLLVICSITNTPIAEASRAMMPYLAILLVCLLVIIAFPWTVVALPRAFGF
jgi:C4-dicarboxylate transporter DctM subunit